MKQKEPTCTDEGEKTHICENCGDSHTEKIPATGHDYVDGTCGNCGEKDPDHHHFVAINRKLSVINTSANTDSRYGSASASAGKNSRMDFLIELPDWYEGYFPCDVSWYVSRPSTSYTASVSLGSGPTQGSSTYNSFSNSGRTSTGSTTNQQLKLYAGANYIYLTASNVNNTSGTVRGTVTFPDELFLERELCRNHICEECHYMEEHYSSETDSTKEEYYFCDECGQQFRHRCMFDDEALAVAQCIGGNTDLECIDDYYDKEHILFDTCGQTSSIYFEGLGHDWKPYVVEIHPTFETAASSSDSSYKFAEGAYGYTGTIGTAKYKSNSTTGTLYIKLPDNFIGTYTLPVSYSISSGSFTKAGYRMDVSCTNYYDYEDGAAITGGKSKSYLNYSLAYASTSAGTTSGTLNVELHAGNNAIRFVASASVNLNTWSTYTGSVTFRTPTMPHSVFSGKEVHKCSRCNIEESHADTLYEIDRMEATCITDGYIRYTCDDCDFIYDEILPKHPDDHADEDDDYICDDCGKDLKTCEEFGHVIEHIQKTYQIPMNFSVKPNSDWYLDEDGYWNIKLKANQLYSDEWIKITYSVPYDFPGTYYLRQGNYVVVHNSNGGKWSYESTASTGLQKGGPYSSSGDVPLTLKSGTCSIEISCFTLDKYNSETHFTIAKKSSLSVPVDVYHCIRCGRTETYNFGDEILVQSISDGNLYFNDIETEIEETQTMSDSELYFDDIETETDGTYSDEQQTTTDENASNEAASDKYVADMDNENKIISEAECSDKNGNGWKIEQGLKSQY